MLQRLRVVGVSAVAMRCLLAVVLPALAAASAGAQVVERVVDGDTIVVQGVGRVRLIGVDTPETVHPGRAVEFFGREASAFTKRLLEGRRVRLSTTGNGPIGTDGPSPTSIWRTGRSPTRR